MAIQPRPVDNVTELNLLFGMPIMEFAPLLSGTSVFGPFRNLGVVDTAAFQKTIEKIALNTSQAGLQRKIREIINVTEASLSIGVFNFESESLRFFFGGGAVTAVSGGVTVVVNDQFFLTADHQDFVDVANQLLEEALTSLDPAQIIDEDVGTQAVGGQAANFGETLGDFALDFKPLVIGDVTLYEEVTSTGVTDRTADLVAGGAPIAGQIGITIGAVADGGKIIYPAGEAPADGTSIRVTYQPSFALTENTNFVVDYIAGRIRILDTINGATDALRNFQPMFADYSYNAVAHDDTAVLTQTTFSGKARLRLLTDGVGRNLIWNIPKVAVQLPEDDFEFQKDQFTVAPIAMELLDDGSATPYGTLEMYPETA